MNESYRAQVRLMLDLLPLVAEEAVFALKGGTAINFFVRDMPRLSVDIDLTYVPDADRASALAGIAAGLGRIKARAEGLLPGARLSLVPQDDDLEVKMHCQRGRARVKIEVNPLQRGSLWPVRTLACSDAVQDAFESFVEVPVVSHADLFGGKVAAALDRQHPRDLFDVRHLLDVEGLGSDVRASLPPRLRGGRSRLGAVSGGGSGPSAGPALEAAQHPEAAVREPRQARGWAGGSAASASRPWINGLLDRRDAIAGA
jgi:hypothetical protein